MGTSLSEPFRAADGLGNGASIVSVPSFDKLLLTSSGFTPFGREKFCVKFLEEYDRPSVVCYMCFEST